MAQQVKITVHPSFRIGEISPRLYGTFMEPIGTIVNGFMYNPKHPTANEKGFRMDVINQLKEAGVVAVRTPGGNFVSGWDWKDSIGPVEQRKAHLDLAWFQYYTNEIGHDEYLQWAEMTGAKAMYTINLGTGDINDAIKIVEYTNHEGGTYWSDLRRKYGHEKPYGVDMWYLGNEMDGPWQIGSWEKNPKGYGILCHETSKAMKWVDPSIKTAVCVSSSPFLTHYPQWDLEVLQECYDTVDYLSMHHYHSAPTGDIKALLGGCDVFYDDYIRTEIALADFVQTKRRNPRKMLLSFDEYGAHAGTPRPLTPGVGVYDYANRFYQFNPERKYVRHDPDNMPQRRWGGGEILGALGLASTQMTFLRHADRVKIGCMTGGLGALCASDRDHVWKSASYYVMTELMRYGRGDSLVTAIDGETFDIPGYAMGDGDQYQTHEGVNFVDGASAYDEATGELNLFVINKNDQTEYPLTLDLEGFKGLTFVKKIELATDDPEAVNSYEKPDEIKPVETSDQVFEGGCLKDHIKPLSFNVYCFKKA